VLSVAAGDPPATPGRWPARAALGAGFMWLIPAIAICWRSCRRSAAGSRSAWTVGEQRVQ